MSRGRRIDVTGGIGTRACEGQEVGTYIARQHERLGRDLVEERDLSKPSYPQLVGVIHS